MGAKLFPFRAATLHNGTGAGDRHRRRGGRAMQEETFDFIVTGAGSAGCAAAARLSEAGRYRVLLLEAGRRDRHPWIHIPIGYHKLYTHEVYNWKFESEPVAGLNGRTSSARRKTRSGARTSSTAWVGRSR